MSNPWQNASETRLFVNFKKTEARLLVAIMDWSRILGRPGGSPDCGYCGCTTQWGWCPQCQPKQFRSLP